ncbi:MAG: hypothetical protein IKP72_02585 [Clostridia bacterium]|jgi:hypothetical protein|nr:hypothetical protein [Clostridia bacterium]
MFFSEGRAAALGMVFRQENIPCRFSARERSDRKIWAGGRTADDRLRREFHRR